MKRFAFALMFFPLLLSSCSDRELRMRNAYDKVVDAIQEEYNQQVMKIQMDNTLVGPEIGGMMHQLDSMATAALYKQGLKLIRKHPSNPGVGYVLQNIYPMVYSTEDLQNLSAVLSKVRGAAVEDESVRNIIANANARNNTIVGKPFVDGELQSVDGKSGLRLSDYVGKGKHVLVFFWASWNPYSKDELPYLTSVYEKYTGEDFEILGIAVTDEAASAAFAIEQSGMAWQQALDPGNSVAVQYGINDLPYTLLFGPDGTILSRGFAGADTIKAVSSALGR